MSEQAVLQKELGRKNEQLSVKDKQIEELNARLAEVSSALAAAQQTSLCRNNEEATPVWRG